MIAILLFVFNIVNIINFLVKDAVTGLGEKISLIAYIKNDAPQDKVEALKASLIKTPGVTSVSVVSKEAALQNFLASHPKTAAYYQKFSLENTFPASIHIFVQHPSYYKDIGTQLEKGAYAPILETVNEGEQDLSISESVTKNLYNIDRFTTTLLLWIIAGFLIGSILILGNIIHLTISHRKKEITIMRLVGATPNFIRLPYLLEAIWCTLIAATISFIAFILVAKLSLLPHIATLIGAYSIPFAWLFAGEMILTLILALLSSFSAIQKHLRHHLALS